MPNLPLSIKSLAGAEKIAFKMEFVKNE